MCKIVEVVAGVTTARVKISVVGGAVITASITMEAAEELALKVVDDAGAIIKASDAIVAKE